MAAPEAPPAVVAEEPVAPPEEPTSPVAEAPAEAGDVEEAPEEAGTGLDLKELLKDATPEELRLALEAAPEEARNGALAEDFRRAEQRGATQAAEELTARNSRSDAYQQGVNQGHVAHQWVMDTASTLPSMVNAMNKALEFEDVPTARQTAAQIAQLMSPQGMQAALTDLRTGAILEHGQRLASEFNQFIGSKADVIGKLSEDEMKELNQLAYNDGRVGTTRTQYRLMEIALDRAEQRGVEKGIQQGLKNKEANLKLAEKLEKVVAARAGSPPQIRGSKAAASNSLKSAMESIDVTTSEGQAEWRAREDEFKRALK